jgi:galactokinase
MPCRVPNSISSSSFPVGGCAVALVDAGQAEEAGRSLRDAYHAASGIDAAWFLTPPAPGPQVVPRPDA